MTMKVKELQICDWVLDKNKKPIKVKTINDNDKCINEVYCQGDIVDEIVETDIEPIRLTPEILKANGFKLDEKYRTQYGWLENEAHIGDTYFVIHSCEDWVHEPKKYINIWVKYDGCVRPSDYHIMYPTYVHELQHALRLCGLNDIADNFKVG